MSQFERSRSEVICAFFSGIRITEVPYIGFSCEPIAIALDPDDEVEGDYVMTAQVEVRVADDKLFSAPFRVTFEMEKMRSISLKALVNNVGYMATAFRAFANDVAEGKVTTGEYVTRDGVTDLATLMAGQEKRKDKLN